MQMFTALEDLKIAATSHYEKKWCHAENQIFFTPFASQTLSGRVAKG